MKRKKVIRAGQLTVAIVYSAPNNLRDGPRMRGAKLKASSAAQKLYNAKTSCRKLEYYLHANFSASDYVVTLTYSPERLPSSRSAAERRVRRFFQALRRERDVRYIYVTEGKHGADDPEQDRRLHHHIVLNGTGDARADAARIRAAWPHGHAHIDRVEPIDMEALARYLTKEPREAGTKPGARMWHQSIGLKRWSEECSTCADNETITPPAGSIVLSNEGERVIDIYGTYKYIKYYEPQYHHNPRYERGRKKR